MSQNNNPVATNDGGGSPVVSVSLGSLSGSAGIKITGAPAGADAGAITSLGDVNGDGHADILVGGYKVNAGGNGNSGRAYVVFGSAIGFDTNIDLSTVGSTTAGFTIDGLASGDFLGAMISGAGDLNNDGVNDILLSSHYTDVNGTDSGSTYVIYGKDVGQGSTFSATFDLTSLDGTNGFAVHGEQTAINSPGDAFGSGISSAGDVNGDGIDDFMVSAQGADPYAQGGDPGRVQAGTTYVIFGTGTPLSTGTFDLTSLDGSNGFAVHGANAGDSFAQNGNGRNVSSAGDFNGDGIDDLLIGTPGHDSGGIDRNGGAFIVYGKNTSQQGVSFSSDFDLATLTSSDGVRITGFATTEVQAGFSVSGAGDINGDGYDDVIIGSRHIEADGGAFVVFGGQPVTNLSAADLDGTNGFRLSGEANLSTGISVRKAGDFNGDGYDDVLIGTLSANSNGVTGSAYVLFGRSDGFAADINLTQLDGTDGFRLNGTHGGDATGRLVSDAGDLNNDGLDDILVGALTADTGSVTNTGAAYVVYGRNYRATEDAAVTIGNVLANDADVDGDALTVTLVDAVSANGAAVSIHSSNGSFNYDPTGAAAIQALAAGQTLTDTFTYTVSDGNGGTDTATVTVTVTGADETNNTPIVVGTVPAQTTDEDALFSFTLPAGLFTDPDVGDTLTLSATQADGSALPTWLTFDAPTSSFSGTPENDDVGVVSVKVVASDGAAQADVTFDLTVTNTNDAPMAQNDGGVPDQSISLGALAGSNGVQIYGAQVGSEAGAVTALGDVNGDGYDDVLIGAYRWDPAAEPLESYGRAHVIYGSATGFDANIDISSLGTSGGGFTIDGLADQNALGAVVSRVGDINNDGIDDILLQSKGADVNGENSGSAYVIYGGGTFGSSFDLTSLDGSNGFAIHGQSAGDEFGSAISGAGDVNGDGIDDFMVFAEGAGPPGRSQAGITYIVFGNSTALSTGTFDVSTLDGTNGFAVYGASAGDADAAGGNARNISSAGDVNGDGVDDLLIGKIGYNPGNLLYNGAAYIVYGKQTSQPGVSFAQTLDLNGLAATDGIRIDGPEAISFKTGHSVSAAGDVNGDGYDDVIVGSFDNLTNSGGASVVFGGSSLANISSTDLDGSNGFNLSGIASQSLGISVRGAGDFNGDGYDDLIIGTFTPAAVAGTAYILFGKGDGFSANVDVSLLDGTDGIRLDGVHAGDLAGRFVSDAGDLNNDGLDDVLVGATQADTGGVDKTGAAYIVYGRNYRATEDAAVTIGNVLANDADVDGDALTVTLVDAVSANGAAVSIHSSNGSFNYDPTGATAIQALAAGETLTDTFTYTVSDGNGGTDTATVTVTVTGADETNNTPILVGTVPAQTTDEDAPFLFTLPAGLFSDPDVGDTLTLSATQADGSLLPTWLTFDAPTSSFSGTPENDDVGVISVRVIASDGAASTDVTFDVTVTNTNDAPVATAGVVAQTTAEDAPFSFALPVGLFSDPDVGDTLILTASQADGSTLPTWLTFDDVTATFSGTPENDDVGVVSVKVTASDGTASTDVTFDVTVTNTNDAPVATAGVVAQTTAEDAPFSFALPAGLFADPDVGDTLTLSATQADGSALPTWLTFDAPTSSFSGTPENDDVGVISVRVIASDGAASTDVTFDVTVTNTNDAPVATAGVVAQTTAEDAPFSFALPVGLFSDPDVGDTLILTASQADGSTLPTWLTFDDVTATFSGTPENDDVGVVSVKVTASDGTASTDVTFDVTVTNTNDAPVATAGVVAQTTAEDAPFSFALPAGLFTDPDVGDTLTLSATQADGSALPTWLTFDALTETFSGTPENGDVGVVSVKVIASDGTAQTDVTFDVTVTNTNDAPTVSVGLVGQSAEDGQGFLFAVPAGTFADVDVGDQLVLSATLLGGAALPSWLAFDAATGTFSGTPANGDVGLLSVSVIATDSAGATATSSFDLTINPPSGDDLLDGVILHGVIDGGPGNDTITYATASGAVAVNLATGVGSGAEATGDSYLNIENAIGSAHNDTLTGDAGNNTLQGNAGADVIDGGAGTDTASYSDSTVGVTVNLATGVNTGGSAGGDQLTSIENLIGSAHADTLTGDAGDNVMWGNAGDDSFFGGAGADTIYGGEGSDSVRGGAGADVLDGGAGGDVVWYDGSTVGVTVDLSLTTAQISLGDADGDILSGLENLAGSSHADTLTGDAGANVIVGGDGNDVINGGAGNDSLYGGIGADTINGGDGLDVAVYSDSSVAVTIDLINGVGYGGTAEGDTYSSIEGVVGSDYNDNLISSIAAESLNGGGGSDQANYVFSNAAVTVDLSSGGVGQGGHAAGDTYVSIERAFGSVYGDVLTGNADANILMGWDGNDTLQGNAGADVIDGGAGTDAASYSDSTVGVTVNLATGINTGGSAEGDQLTAIENLIGSAHADTLTGDAGDNVMWGNAGDDSFFGGAGADTIYGGDGSDSVRGGAGADVLDGGAGGDIVWYDGSTVGVTVDLSLSTAQISLGDADGDILSGFENLAGSSHADTLTGDAAANVIVGGDGNDVIYGNNGDDALYGGDGNDNLFGQAGADVIDGGAGTDVASYASSWAGVTVNLTTGVNTGGTAEGDQLTSIENLSGSIHDDVLTGDAGANTLWGWAGNDTLNGGAGADTLNGGDGSDTVSYAGSGVGVVVNLDTGGTFYGDAEGDTLVSIENLEGSAHADQLFGTSAVNTLSGGAGNDLLGGGLGADVLDGGEGSDWAWYSNALAGVTVNLATNVHSGADAAGDNLISIENVYGTFHLDTLIGDAGDNVLDGRGGADLLDGGVGIDTAQYIHSTGGVTVDLLAGTGTGSVAEGDTLTNIENITGSSHADTLSGDHAVNTLWGNAGDDVLYGNNGDDTLYGGDGNDNLFGQAGADVIDGGAGTDVASYASSWAGVTVNLATDVNTGGTAEGDQLTSIENLSGSVHDDVLTGDAGANTLWGWAGNDTLKGGAGFDTLYGGDGTDTAVYDGVLADYTVSAGSGGVWTVTHISTGDVDTLTGIETASFSDQTADLSNSPPVAVADTHVTSNFGISWVSPAALLANDSDPDGDTLTIHSVGNATGIVQSVSISYLPGSSDVFSINPVIPSGLALGTYYGTYDYTVTDGNGGFATTTVNYQYTEAVFTKPIVLDMDGDGIELVNADDADIFLDLNGDGEAERTGWAAADDGLLVFDKDMDGAATDIDEISFVGYKEGARTDLEGLRAFDTNGDGLLDAGDAQFGSFKVWRDQNQNGVSEAGELQSLTAAGISAIELTSDETVRVVGDNVSFGLGSFHKSDGTTGTLSDTAFGSEGLSIDSGSLDALEVAAGEAGFADAGDGAVVHQLRAGLDDILASGGADGLLDKPVLSADRPVILDNAVAGLVSAMAAFDAKSAGQSSLANRAEDTSSAAQLAAWVS